MDSFLSLKISQLGNLALSSGLLHSSWSKISEIHDTPCANRDRALEIKIHEEANLTFVVFAVLPVCKDETLDTATTLVSVSQNPIPFRFLCSEKFSSFSVHNCAFEAFMTAYKDLSDLKSKLRQSKKSVIITGAALGGSVASLFTLWLLDIINPRQKRPLCITFGSPLIGDASLQHILEDTLWNSCFLHVADAAKTSITTGFKPFGTFFICYDSECICIEDPEAVMELLRGVNGDLVDYGEVLQRLDQSVLLSGVDSRLMIDDIIDRMEEHAQVKKRRSDSVKNDTKIPMIYVEWYKKKSKESKIGYYDYFKCFTTSQSLESYKRLMRCKEELNEYWKVLVEELERKPNSFRSRRFLFAGSNYRRMIEPLDIAEYYSSGGKEYRKLGRSLHYIMLEKWFQKELIEQKRFKRSDLTDLLTFDSCFWAEVEEAIIAINLLKTQEGVRDKVLIRKLLRFEDYMWGMINKREVSPEIFLENSSFMRWWKEYKEFKEKDGFNSQPSLFFEFMNTGAYKKYGLASFEGVDIDSYPVESILPFHKEEPYEIALSGPTPSLTNSEDSDTFRPRTNLELVSDKLQDVSRKDPVLDGKSDTTIPEVANEMTELPEVLVFSCNDNRDGDEKSFIKAISNELLNQKVYPLTYNLLAQGSSDEAMLDKSSVGIIILSNSYARSGETLDHLMEIIEYGKATNLVIIPIYFKVTRAEICGSGGWFEEVLQDHYSVQAEKVRKWKTTMTEITSNSGYEWTKGEYPMLVKEVVRNACRRLYLKNSKNMVRVLAMLKDSQPPEADFFGIWGMAGIGKTAIAREVYEILASQYDLCYFFQDFHLMCQNKGVKQMRDDFYSKLFEEEKLSIGASDIKPSFMRNWFQKKTILVVLDDVSNARDVEAVVGGFGWFSCGHRIILTSRRKQVLVQCKVQEPYEMQKLCEFESSRLCKLYIENSAVISELMSCSSGIIISELMSCSSGIPLALKVLVSSVSKQPIEDMKAHPVAKLRWAKLRHWAHLQSLRRKPPTKIQKAFRRSFGGLDENERNIFLDLACFFEGGNIEYVVQLLDACGFLAYLGICDLVDESLISLLDNKIEIPIPFQDIGRLIVHEEDEDPCERSRLWDSKDITNVLTNNTGTDAIEVILLDATDLTCELNPTVFDKMYRLRLLKFHSSTSTNECKLSLPRGLDSLPDELRLLHWENYPLESLPQKFNAENLVELNMPYSNMVKLWEGKKNLSRLKTIRLSHSRYLTDIKMLSEALNLEHIDLEGCTSLVDVSTSIPCNGKLVSLNMKDCSHLRSLPTLADLTSLTLLNMSGCSELEEIQDIAPNLKEIYLAGTAITVLPLSFENLSELVTLDLENCGRLQQLPFGIKNSRSIVELKLSGCTSLELRKRKRSVSKHDLTGQDE